MSFRFMRVLVMFDLPTNTNREKRDYRNFRKFLINSGFLMLQESVYCKLSQNDVSANSVIENLKKHKTRGGMILALKVTEKQYTKMEYIVGEKQSEIIDSTDSLIIL